MHFKGPAFLFLLVSFQSVLAVRPRYQHFEDYLNNLDTNEQSWIAKTAEEETDEESNKDNDESSSSTTVHTTTSSTTPTPSYIQTSSKSKDVACCMLGQLAGDKGYHCYSQYYAARIIMRNRNRAHNRKMAFYGPQRIRNYGLRLMHTFEQCVAGRGVVFHKCCHLASMERRIDRFDTVQRMRHQQHDDDETDDGDDDDSDDKSS